MASGQPWEQGCEAALSLIGGSLDKEQAFIHINVARFVDDLITRFLAESPDPFDQEI